MWRGTRMWLVGPERNLWMYGRFTKLGLNCKKLLVTGWSSLTRGNVTAKKWKKRINSANSKNCEFVFFLEKKLPVFFQSNQGHTLAGPGGEKKGKTRSKSAENPTLQSVRLEGRRLTILSLPKMSHPLTLFVTCSKSPEKFWGFVFLVVIFWIYAASRESLTFIRNGAPD